MRNNHVQENSANPSTKQSNPDQIWEQLDLFEWAGRMGLGSEKTQI